MLLAQPFIYKDDHFTSNKNKLNPLSRYIRINLTNGHRDTVFQHHKILMDNTQSWMVDGDRSDIIIYNTLNKNLNLRINFDPGIVVYSKSKYKLYILGNYKSGSLFTVLNAASGKKELSLPIKIYDKYGEIFLSENEENLYIPYYDTAFTPVKLNEIKLAYVSTSSNKIFKKKSLAEIGMPGADIYYLVNGRKGKGIIESRLNTDDSYFNIYDFDRDYSSPFIFYHGNAEPYFTNNGKYLILAEKTDTIINGKSTSVFSGSIILYDVLRQSLLKTLFLSPGGQIYFFDNYPDFLYYVENKTGKIITLNIENLINN